jgi:hypothetical protein
MPYGNVESESLAWFYSISNDYNLGLSKNIMLFIHRIPKELIPIGCDGCGNQICLGVAGERYNKVYFWDHEEEMDGEETEPWYDNIYLIANSFEEFINKLHYLDVNVNSDNNLIITRVYDHYALPTSHYIKHYKPGVIVDFFKQAPAGCDEFKIIEHEESRDLELIFEDKEQGIRKKRLLRTDSSYTDAAEKI